MTNSMEFLLFTNSSKLPAQNKAFIRFNGFDSNTVYISNPMVAGSSTAAPTNPEIFSPGVYRTGKLPCFVWILLCCQKIAAAALGYGLPIKARLLLQIPRSPDDLLYDVARIAGSQRLFVLQTDHPDQVIRHPLIIIEAEFQTDAPKDLAKLLGAAPLASKIVYDQHAVVRFHLDRPGVKLRAGIELQVEHLDGQFPAHQNTRPPAQHPTAVMIPPLLLLPALVHNRVL